jgi:nucleotide-binding universal stress UspA family protein
MTNSKLTVLHVHSTYYHKVAEKLPTQTVEGYLEKVLETSKKQFSALEEKYKGHDLFENMIFEKGAPWEVISEKATEFDLIIMATQSSGSWSNFFLGSTAELVLERSHKSTMIVKG